MKTRKAQLAREIAEALAKTPSDESSDQQRLLWIPFTTKGSISIAKPVPVDFSAKDVKSVWTLTANRNPAVRPALPLHPVHGHGAFLEDYGHDWTIRAGNFIYRSRITDRPVWVMLQL
jgi:hypothetical protein